MSVIIAIPNSRVENTQTSNEDREWEGVSEIIEIAETKENERNEDGSWTASDEEGGSEHQSGDDRQNDGGNSSSRGDQVDSLGGVGPVSPAGAGAGMPGVPEAVLRVMCPNGEWRVVENDDGSWSATNLDTGKEWKVVENNGSWEITDPNGVKWSFVQDAEGTWTGTNTTNEVKWTVNGNKEEGWTATKTDGDKTVEWTVDVREDGGYVVRNDQGGSWTVEGEDGEWTVTENAKVPATFFSALAYSVEAFLAAADAQKESMLMQNQLYCDQAVRQSSLMSSIAQTIKESAKEQAKVHYMSAINAMVSGSLGIVQGIGTGLVGGIKVPFTDGKKVIGGDYNDRISKATERRDNIESYMSKIDRGNTTLHGKAAKQLPPPDDIRKNLTVADVELHCRTNAWNKEWDKPGAVRPLAKGLDQRDYDMQWKAQNLGSDYKDAVHRLKDDYNAASNDLNTLQMQKDGQIRTVQMIVDMLKNVGQAATSWLSGVAEERKGEIDAYKAVLDSVKELLTSFLQQVQNRMSSAEKGMSDEIDKLSRAIQAQVRG